MQTKNILITGASSGLAKAIVDELASEDFIITIIGRNRDKLALFKKPNVRVVYGDATDELLINKVVNDLKPGIIILNAGATPVMAPLDDPEYLEGAAYGIRKDTGLKLFDY
jgi:NAD(P)-dependent dehydrogenase (short-subunit alcohol dehydrogenase family)